MRIIENEMVESILSGKNFSKSNIVVNHRKSETDNKVHTYVYLHGNMIADINEKEIFISTCGYSTNTTKNKINCILGALSPYTGIRVISNIWYLFTNGEKQEFKGTAIIKR